MDLAFIRQLHRGTDTASCTHCSLPAPTPKEMFIFMEPMFVSEELTSAQDQSKQGGGAFITNSCQSWGVATSQSLFQLHTLSRDRMLP